MQERRGHKFAGGERLGEEDLRELCNDLGKGLERAVIPLTQFHGQLVRVPPGYVHLVHNLRSCVKVAWDLYRVENLHLYISMLRRNRRYFGDANAQDYMSSPSYIMEMIKRFVRA